MLTACVRHRLERNKSTLAWWLRENQLEDLEMQPSSADKDPDEHGE